MDDGSLGPPWLCWDCEGRPHSRLRVAEQTDRRPVSFQWRGWASEFSSPGTEPPPDCTVWDNACSYCLCHLQWGLLLKRKQPWCVPASVYVHQMPLRMKSVRIRHRVLTLVLSRRIMGDFKYLVYTYIFYFFHKEIKGTHSVLLPLFKMWLQVKPGLEEQHIQCRDSMWLIQRAIGSLILWWQSQLTTWLGRAPGKAQDSYRCLSLFAQLSLFWAYALQSKVGRPLPGASPPLLLLCRQRANGF